MKRIAAVLTSGAVLAGTLMAATPAEATVGQNVRFATYNASLNRGAAGQLVTDLSQPGNAQANEVAEVIQRNRPDVLLINEFDYVPENRAANLFRENYLKRGQNGAAPIDYPYAFTAPSNTGVATGFDLDRNGQVGGGNDAHGFGLFEGQYGMLVLSKYPIDTKSVRTFQKFLWKDMPGALLPDDPATPAPNDWYSPQALDVLRLSSKSHWDGPRPRRPVHRPLPDRAPDTAHLRRPRRPQRHPQQRRDPVLGGLRVPGQGPLHPRRPRPSRRP